MMVRHNPEKTVRAELKASPQTVAGRGGGGSVSSFKSLDLLIPVLTPRFLL